MATIGMVTRKADGSFEGRLKTLTIDGSIRIVPVKKKMKDEHPDFRVFVEGLDLGAAWKKISKEKQTEYVSASVSAPEFGTLYFNLGRAAGQDDDDVFALIWNEKQKK